jgi:hypothetical protein
MTMSVITEKLQVSNDQEHFGRLWMLKEEGGQTAADDGHISDDFISDDHISADCV